MRRRKKADASSLDLFLDTICNTFGGIVFLAILLSILVQMRSKEPVIQNTEMVPVTAKQYLEISSDFDDLTSKRIRLLTSIAQLRVMQGTPEDAKVQQRQRIVDERQKDLDAVVDKQAASAQKLARQLQENAEIVQDLEALELQLTEEQAALEQEQTALDEALADKMEVLKLPKVQTTFKANVIMLLRYGKLYPIYEVQSDVTFAKHVNVTKSITSLAVSARPRAGWDLSDPVERKEAAAYLAAHPSSRYFVSIAVWEDSFAEFAELKSLIRDLGHEYQLQPFGKFDEVVISKSSELPTIQ